MKVYGSRAGALFLALIFVFAVAPAQAQVERNTGTQPSTVPSFGSAATPSASNTPQTGAPDLRLKLAQVSLDAATGKINDAYGLLDELKIEYPNNPQVLLAEADLDFRIGDSARGFALLNKASILDPGNEDILNRQRAEMLSQGPFASAGYNFRHTSEANEQVAKASGQIRLGPTLTASLVAENEYMSTRMDIPRVNGTVQGFHGNRQRGTLMLDKIFDDGNEAAASLYGANDIAGGGGLYRWWDHHGATSLQANLFRPYWDFVEAVIEHGTKSNIRLERKQIITTDIQATLGGGFNHYELRNANDVADSAGWDLYLGYGHPFAISSSDPNEEIVLNANYTVDGEYFTHVDTNMGPSGAFHPLPAHSYEIHSMTVSVSKDIISSVTAEGFGGYAVDRISGSNGPLYGFVVNYTPLSQLGIEVHGSRTRLGGENNSQREDNLGVNVKWLW